MGGGRKSEWKRYEVEDLSLPRGFPLVVLKTHMNVTKHLGKVKMELIYQV
jgi:hypothetical protein